MYNPFFPSRDIKKNVQILDKSFTNWLYGEWNKEKLDTFNKLYAIYPFRAYIDYKLDVRSDEEYLNRYDMDYSDVHDPRKLKQTTSAANMYSTAYRMVSKNVARLYR